MYDFFKSKNHRILQTWFIPNSACFEDDVLSSTSPLLLVIFHDFWIWKKNKIASSKN